MHDHGPLLDAIILFGAALLIVPLFQRIRVSPILGYLLAGVAIGPTGLGLATDTPGVQALAEIGVVFLLFSIGLELPLRRLAVMRRLVFGLGTVQVVVSATCLGLLGLLLVDSPEVALIAGASLALSSTAMVTQLLIERHELSSRAGRAAFSVLLMQDLAVVPLLVLVPLLGAGSGSVAAALGGAALNGALAIGAIVLLGRYVLRPMFHAIAISTEMMTAMTLLIVLGAAFVTGSAGLSLPLGAFLAGLLLAETEYKPQVAADIQPFRRLLMGLFFMTVGMAIDLRVVFAELPVILAVVCAVIVGKTAILTLAARMFGFPWRMSTQIGLMLAQGGEFAFVVFGLAVASGLLPRELGDILLAAVTLTMVVTPALLALGRRVARRGEGEATADLPAPEATEDRRVVLIAGFGRVGQTIAKMLDDDGIPWRALDLSPARIRAARTAGKNVFFGDISRAEVLDAVEASRALAVVVTLDSPDATEAALEALRRHCPGAPIFARAHDHIHARLLEAAGATATVPETLEASLQLGGIVLRALDRPAEGVEATIDRFRHNAGDLLVDIVPKVPRPAAEEVGEGVILWRRKGRATTDDES